jgi:hypothetical protein
MWNKDRDRDKSCSIFHRDALSTPQRCVGEVEERRFDLKVKTSEDALYLHPDLLPHPS